MNPNGSPYWCNDRKGTSNGALCFGGSYCTVPSGVYFNSAFTITVWVFPSNVSFHSRIIDFGNGLDSDNIVLSLSYLNSLQPYFVILSGSNLVFAATSSQPITLNQWQLVVATFNGTNARIYLNGTLVADSNTQNHTRSFYLARSNCYIGKSNWNVDGYSHSYLDDLRFYNKSLTQEEIIELMNYSKSKTNLFSQITFILN